MPDALVALLWSELEASKLKMGEDVCDDEDQVKIGLGSRLISFGQDSMLFSQVPCQGARENWLTGFF